MKAQDIQAQLKAILEQYAQIEKGAEQALVTRLLNLIENMGGQIEALKGEVQELRDENNRLKGEQGKRNRLEPQLHIPTNAPCRPSKCTAMGGSSGAGKPSRAA